MLQSPGQELYKDSPLSRPIPSTENLLLYMSPSDPSAVSPIDIIARRKTQRPGNAPIGTAVERLAGISALLVALLVTSLFDAALGSAHRGDYELVNVL